MKSEPLRLRDIIPVDYTDGDTPEDSVGLIPYQYHKRHRSYVEDEEMDVEAPSGREVAMARSAARAVIRLEVLDGSSKDDLPLARRLEIERIIAKRKDEVDAIAQTILDQNT
jgi:hypothetical protein